MIILLQRKIFLLHILTLVNKKVNTVLAKQNYQSDPRILNLDIGNLDLTLAPYSLKTGKH
jgi:hypothetical protein